MGQLSQDSGVMSKTRLFQSVKSLNLDAVAFLLEAHPELTRVRDERGRNALHLVCSLERNDKTTSRSLKLAEYLLGAGIDVNAPAFVEGAFEATPLWYAISRGRNLPMAKLLLKQQGASVDPVTEDETPLLGAIKWSCFAAAERLLRHGANPNFQDSKGVTALHLVLKKNSERKHVEMLLRHGADPRLRNREGISPLDMVERRRDKTYFNLLSARRSPR